MSVVDLATREERPAYVSFERVPVEDVEATKRTGRYVAKDVDYVNVTPTYSRDVYRAKAESWLAQVERDVAADRTPRQWLEMWRKAYEAWKQGQEMPLNGTPIKGWALLSPAQQEMLVRMNCRTVEDLAETNAEGLARIGIGALDLKNKAIAWLKTAADRGTLALRASDLERENSHLKSEVETLKGQVDAMMQQMRALAAASPSVPEERIAEIEEMEIPTLTPAKGRRRA